MKFFSAGLAVLMAIGSPAAARADWPDDLQDGAWLIARTASVRLYHQADAPVSAFVLRDLEAAVQRLGRRLAIDPARMLELRDDPIEYLYAQNGSRLSWYGHPDVDGLAIVAERKVLATRVPHEHELVHVLAWLAIRPALAGNQPWLQEGLASYLGGQLGETPSAVLAMGEQVLLRSPGLFPRIFRAGVFRNSPLGQEACYAASARLVQYLDEEHGGIAPLLELLQLLSGAEEEIRQRPAAAIETQLEGVYGMDIAELMEDFVRWRTREAVAGIIPAQLPRRAPDLDLRDTDHRVRWWAGPEGWVIATEALQQEIDLALVWGSELPSDGVWSAPAPRSGFELRLDEHGGRLLDHDGPSILLRWYGDAVAPDGSRAWFIPAAALGEIRAPGSESELVLWSAPRFEVD